MSSQNQKMKVELTQKPTLMQLNCKGKSACSDCYEGLGKTVGGFT